jgi:hypothetical protein
VIPVPALPPVHFTASDAPSLPDFKTKEADIDLLAMQAAMRLTDHPEDTPLQKNIRAAIVDFLTTRQAADEPVWPDFLNPMVWVPRTLKGASSWWSELIKIAPAQRPVFSGLPFLWSSDEIKPRPGAPAPTGHALSAHLNNDGLVTLFAVGDSIAADDLLSRAVTADKDYAIPAYNAGVLQMALHNRAGANKRLFNANDVASDPLLKQRIMSYLIANRSLDRLLKNDPNTGSQRRLYAESIDTSWALLNANQYDLASYVAGQGVVLDPEERRSEAPLLLALCASKKNDAIATDHWLGEALARYQKYDSGRPELLALVKQARAELPK